jgi:hypothetical protein
MREATRATWSARVAEWKQSGQTAAAFAADKPYKDTTLVWRAWKLRQSAGAATRFSGTGSRGTKKTGTKIALAEVVRRAPDEEATARILVEVVGARIAVTRGFDAALLREVVQALRGAR